MGVAVLIGVLVILLALVVGGLYAAGRSQGAESTVMMTGFAEEDEAAATAAATDLTAAISEATPTRGQGAPEPGPPPTPGAQWDEIAARWIVWDAESGSWVPVEPA